jgi:hypothetical protein
MMIGCQSVMSRASSGNQRAPVAARCPTASPAVASEVPRSMGVERLTGFIVQH